ncbi:MAG: CIA30 family protein [Planctomycetes bacterium]|nr:CIA30 family protein [Planctomycetota bacterium]
MLRRILVVLAAAAPIGAATTILDTFDAMTVTQPASLCTVSLVPARTGNGIQLAWQTGSKSLYAGVAAGNGSAAWDSAAGISFWVKGDGSDHLGAIEFIWNGDYAQRYAAAFRIDSTAWTKVMIPWSDVLPEVSNAGNVPLDPAGVHKPSLLQSMAFGKWWYWRDDLACTYIVDDFALESTIIQDTNFYRPSGSPLARVRAKLQAGQPISVVTMGDSLTDYLHNSNTTTNWPTYFRNGALSTYSCTATVVNPAIGGTTLRANVVMLPKWTQITTTPDLVTIFFGGNDWGTIGAVPPDGIRGPQFRLVIADAIRRVRRATLGTADVMVMTTCPMDVQWDTMAELADAGRLAAADENAGVCDIWNVFHTYGSTHSQLFASDQVHLSSTGQQVVATAVLNAINAGGGTTTGTTTGTPTSTSGSGTSGTSGTSTSTSSGSTTSGVTGGTGTVTDTGGTGSTTCGLGGGLASLLTLATLACARRRRR